MKVNGFFIVQQLIVVLTIVSQLWIAARVVADSKGAEQYVRVMSFATGALIFLGSQALGITFADLMLFSRAYESLSLLILLGAFAPFIVGIAISEATIHALRRGELIAVRVMLLVGVFTISQVAYTNYVALAFQDVPVQKAFIPNLCYSISVGLWLTFRYSPKALEK